jgi:hypothetical protein
MIVSSMTESFGSGFAKAVPNLSPGAIEHAFDHWHEALLDKMPITLLSNVLVLLQFNADILFE